MHGHNIYTHTINNKHKNNETQVKQKAEKPKYTSVEDELQIEKKENRVCTPDWEENEMSVLSLVQTLAAALDR